MVPTLSKASWLGLLTVTCLLALLVFSSASTPAVSAQTGQSCQSSWRVVPSANRPGPDSLASVAALSANNVLAAGSFNTCDSSGCWRGPLIMRWDGTSWNPILTVGKDEELHAITATSADDIWALGGSAAGTLIEHWDGKAWNTVPGTSSFPVLRGIGASAPNDVWAVGGDRFCTKGGCWSHSTILHWDGTTWSTGSVEGGPELSGVAALSSNSVWGVGTAQHGTNDSFAEIEHWDGTSWTVVSSSIHGSLGGIAALSADDIWAVGSVIEHWNGIRWDVVPGATTGYLYGVAAVSTNDVWAVGGNSDASPLVEHWDGTLWRVVSNPSPLGAIPSPLRGIAIVSNSDIWAVGNSYDRDSESYTLHWDGMAWHVVSTPPVGIISSVLSKAAVLTANNVWAVGGGGDATLTEQWDGIKWRVVPSPNVSVSSSNGLSGVAAISAADIWAVGGYAPNREALRERTLIEHWNGTTWEIVPSPNYGEPTWLMDVAAISPYNVWAVGSYNDGAKMLIEHWDGTSWTIIPNVGAGELGAIKAISAKDIWAVGSDGKGKALALHWDGVKWRATPISNGPSTNTSLGGSLHAVASRSAKDLWAVGTDENGNGLVLHGDGSQWQVIPSPSPGGYLNDLAGVAVSSGQDVWAIGSFFDNVNPIDSHPWIEHWNGAEWSVVPKINPGHQPAELLGIAMGPDGEVWTVGDLNPYTDFPMTLTLHLGLGASQLSLPENGAIVPQPRVRLVWSAALCGVSYEVIVKQDSIRGARVDSKSGVGLLEYTTKELVRGKTYFWRVSACNTGKCKSSDWWSFTVSW